MMASFLSFLIASPLLVAQGEETQRELLQAHVEALTSEEFGGRVLGSPGTATTLDYLLKTLAGYGFLVGESAPQEGAGPVVYRQSYPMMQYSHAFEPKLILTKVSGGEVQAKYGRDFTVNVHGLMRGTEKLEIYRFSNPDLPLSVASPQRALLYELNPAFRQRVLIDRGLQEPDSWGLEVRGLDGTKPGYSPGQPPVKFLSQGPGEERYEVITLLGDYSKDLRWLGFSHVQFFADERVEEVDLTNLVAVLPGSDPALANESVLLQAYYDHVPAVHLEEGEADRGIHSAGSLAALLEVARQMSQGAPPARTLVFLFSAGRDRGSFGVDHYLDHPARPLEGVVGALTVVRPGVVLDPKFAPEGGTLLSHFDKSPLGAACQAAGLPLVAGKPNKALLVRASTLMRKHGLPAQALGAFSQLGRGDLIRDRLLPTDYDQLELALSALSGAARLLVGRAYVAPPKPAVQKRR